MPTDMRWSRRVFRWLMRVYPARIREQRGEDMWLTFVDHLHDARKRGWFAVLQLWHREIAGLWRGARAARSTARQQQHVHRRRNPRSRSIGTMVDAYWLDVKLGLRMLVKSPGLTIVGGLGMAVAIAISTGFLAFFYSHLNPTLPLEEGDRIVALENWNVDVNNEERHSLHDFFTWRDEMTSVEDIGAFRTVGRNLILDDAPVQGVAVAEITAAGFRVARVPPLLGRALVEEDERMDAAQVLVIGYDAWRNRFGADSNVIGRDVRLGGSVHTIIGVMPNDFYFPVSHQFWIPFRADPSDYERDTGPEIFIFGRLAPGATRAEAQAELRAIGLRTAAALPETNGQLRPQILSYTSLTTGRRDVAAWQIAIMQMLVSLLLVVVAANVAVLMYARTARRRAEIAVRTALGASRGRIVLQLFVEAFVLSMVAGGVGLLLARFGLHQSNLMSLADPSQRPFWFGDDFPTAAVAYVVGLTALAAIIVGVVPGLQATGFSLQASLRRVGTGAVANLGRTWTVLIVAQVGVAVAGVSVSAAMGWTQIFRFSAIEPTYPREEYLAGRLVVDQERPPGVDRETYERESANRYTTFRTELMRRLAAEAGISAVTFAMSHPGSEGGASISLGAGMSGPGAERYEVRFNEVDVNLLEVFGGSIVAGRAFREGDARDQSNPVIVNRAFVRQISGDGNAVGRRFRYERGGPPIAGTATSFEVVGVVNNLYENRFDPNAVGPVVYHSLAPGMEETLRPVVVVVRATGGATPAMAAQIRGITSGLDPTLRMAGMGSLESIHRQGEIMTRLAALVLTSVIISVLLLSASGIYAMLSFAVTQQRREIGIRTALGARPRTILMTVFRRAVSQLALGVVVGVGLSAYITPLIGRDLPVDLSLVLLGVSALMIAVGILAAVGPARRGLRIQPSEALRGAD